jgi:hypothetical protein
MNKAIFVALSLGLFLAETLAQPSISFEETRHDFGAVKEEGGKVLYVFGFRNTGTEDLIVSKVETPCGCTSPKWTKAAIPPGEGGYVEATFDPMNRPGVFSKVLTVITNGTPPKAYLTIMGEVLPRKRTVLDEFPAALGNLRMKTPQVVMGKVRIGTIDTVHVRLFNNGSVPIQIKGFDLPEHIKIDVVTQVIEPGRFGKFVLRYDGLKRGELGMVTDFMTIYTDDPLGSDRIIYVVAEIEQAVKVLSPKELAEAPKIVVNEMMIDLGDVAEGQDVSGAFTIVNEGKKPLHIMKVQPECGCTTTKMSSESVLPGKSTTIDLTFSSEGYSGLVIKNIDVYTNDPVNPKIILRVKAFVNN